MKNILLIDDDLNHLAVLAVALIEAGYQVIPKIDAESDIAVLRENFTIDLIIMDYEMPGLDALSFMTMLRELTPNVPVIALTEHGSVDGFIHAMSLGAFEYMNKPVQAGELIRIVNAALERPGAHDHLSIHGGKRCYAD